MSTRPQPRHVVVVTPEQSLLMDVWAEYAYEYNSTRKPHDHTPKKATGLWAGGHSTLESIESYLLEHKLMSKRGNLYRRIEL